MAVTTVRIHEPGEPPRDVALEPGMTIGRAATNRCLIKDETVSGVQARVVDIGGDLAIMDAGSKNKTQVVGGPALAKDQHARLIHGLRVKIGNTLLEFVGDGDDAGATIARTNPPPAGNATVPRASPALEATKPKPAAPLGEDATVNRAAKAPPQPAPLQPAPSVPASAPRVPASAPALGDSAAERAAKAPPVPATSGQHLEPDDAEMTQMTDPIDLSPARIAAALDQAKPRLVVRARQQGSVIAITEGDVVIGRRKAKDVAIALEDDGVSTRHARIKITGRRFMLTDLESRNHTLLNKEQLAPNFARELQGDAWIRFGTVDALFVTEPGAGIECPDAATYDHALAFLAETNVLAGESLKSARDLRRQGRHPAEKLIVDGTLGVAQWFDAVATGRLRSKAGGGGGDRKVLLILGGIVIALALAVVLVLLLRR